MANVEIRRMVGESDVDSRYKLQQSGHYFMLLKSTTTCFYSILQCVLVCVGACVCVPGIQKKKAKKWKEKLGIIFSFCSCLFKTFIYSLATSIQWQAHSLGGPCTLCYPKDLPEYCLTSHLLFVMENVCPKVTYSEMKSNYVILWWEVNNAQCVSYSSE